VLFPGTNDLQSITWSDASVDVLSFARDTVDRNRQLALGGIWDGEHFSLSGDLSYSYSYHDLYFSGLTLNTSAAGFSHDLGGSIPATAVSGIDLMDASNYTYTGVLYRTWPFEGDLYAARLDLDYEVGGGLIDSLEAGVRVARRTATDKPGLIFGDVSVGGILANTMPGYITANPYSDFFPGSNSIGSYLAGDISSARDPDALRNAFGISAPLPTSNPLATWEVKELTQAAYLKANLLLSDPALDGNLGLRVARTEENLSGYQSVPPSDLLGEDIPLQNLSKNSYNIVGMYEKGPVSVRIAYNWRSRYLSSIANVVGVGALPVYTEDYGWLDASLRYRFNSQVSLSIDGTNLQRTERTSYYDSDTRPQSAWLNDRQISVTLSVKLP
jgi:hypothetical protein